MEPMRYVSTRGIAPVLEFGDVLLTGLARDGGLYVPEQWPTLAPGLVERAAAQPYVDTAVEVMWPYVAGSVERDRLAELVRDAYATFDDPAVVPLTDLGGGTWLAELFHGPTLAFKDLALQLVGRLFEEELDRRQERVTIIGATSGDTGSAAIEACRGRDAIEIFMLHPSGRVSEVQRRQMTTVDSPNVHNLAIDGTFDDCQDLVKALFADTAFRDRHHLSAVNSINWARVMAQIVYYVTASGALGGGASPVAFSVPTGNFGNVFTGWVALRTGAPISQLVIGSNRNDILTRWLDTGRLEMAEVHATLSPAMDIQVSSNQERLLFELYGRDGARVSEAMLALRAEGRLDFAPDEIAALSERWAGARLDDDETLEVIRRTYERTGELLDPHTAVGFGAAERRRRDLGIPMVCLATAHPAKFPDAVEQATGVRPALPDRLAGLLDRPEHLVELPNELAAVRDHIAAHAAA